MEFEDLQNIWIEYDRKLSESTRLNKEILKRMLIIKPEKRLNRVKIKAGFKLILMTVGLFFFVPDIHYRAAIDFFIGALLFGIVILLAYFWQVKYFIRIRKVDFTNSITLIEKNLKELAKFKIKITRFGCILIPFAATGIFMMAENPILSKDFILPLALIFLVSFTSVFYIFNYSVLEQFKKLNTEIEEIEKLEK